MAKQLLGKEVTAALNEKIKANVAELQGKGVNPTLCIIRVGENPSDISYERGATKRCETLGVACEKILLPGDVTQEELLATIDKVNKDDHIHGVLLFRPLPKHLDQAVIENALAAEKDVDCMTDLSMSGVYTGKKIGFPPCTPQACMEILDHYGIDCTGKKAVVIGRSLVVGKPAAMMLVKKNATVTICHTKTVDMPSVAKEADIVIVAAGRAGVVGAEYVREGQTIIDVGINVNAEGKLCGDVDYAAVEPIVDAITPVPGGVGSVTTSVLVGHVVEAAMRKVKWMIRNKKAMLFCSQIILTGALITGAPCLASGAEIEVAEEDGTSGSVFGSSATTADSEEVDHSGEGQIHKPSSLEVPDFTSDPDFVDDSTDNTYGYYTIMGCTTVDAEDMVVQYEAQNVEYPSGILTEGGAPDIDTFLHDCDRGSGCGGRPWRGCFLSRPCLRPDGFSFGGGCQCGAVLNFFGAGNYRWWCCR